MSSTSFPEAEITGALRDCTRNGKGRRRLRSGDIAVIDAPQLSRSEAQFLVDARPSAVVNVASFDEVEVPTFGPLMLLDAGIAVFDKAGAELRASFRDGAKKGRIDETGGIFNGTKLLASASALPRESAEQNFAEAQAGFSARMEAFFGNTAQLLESEAPLFIDGLGIPDTNGELAGRKVLVVAPGPDHRSQLEQLRNFIREYDPVFIGVSSAADSLIEMGLQPSFVVGDPQDISAETLRSGARVILPADPDGHAVGLERIQDLGVGAMTFPAAISQSTELALLLAADGDPDLVVICGDSVDLDGIFSGALQASPDALLTRTKLGRTLVDAEAIIKLYAVSGTSLGWLWALLGILVAVAAIIVVLGVSGDASFLQNLIDSWNSLALWFQGLFS